MKELEKLILEALYLGIQAGEMIDLIHALDSGKKGGESND
jgi:GntR family transcriptional regulator